MSGNKGIWGATMEGIKGQFKKGSDLETGTVNMNGRHCLVTGANSGLGRACAKQLAAGDANIVMAVRTMDEQARSMVSSASTNADVVLEHLDLASFSSVYDFVSRMRAQNKVFDVVLLNAAVVTSGPQTTGDQLDEMVQVNYLANVCLLEALMEHKLITDNARVVVVSSEAHRWTEKIDLESISRPMQFALKGVLPHYSDTKFMMATYCATIARRFEEGKRTIAAICPGAVNSNLARQAPAILQPLLKLIFTLFFASPDKAARPVVQLCTTEIANGSYYHRWKKKEFDPRTGNREFGEQLQTAAIKIIAERGSSE